MIERLCGLADENRLPHAMMLCGPDGCGKMALAIGLATYILNKGTYQVKGISHPDLHFTFPTIKLAKWNSEYKPISDDFIEQWNEMLAEGPYFSLAQWMEAMKDRWEELPPYFITSSEKKQGRDEILDYIDQINKSL